MSLTHEKNYARDSRYNPQTIVSFFNELETEMGTMLITIVSFFSDVSTETQKYPRNWFHFLMSLKSENRAQSWFHFLTSLKSENHAQSWFHFLMRLKE
jgi:hypothetical protein